MGIWRKLVEINKMTKLKLGTLFLVLFSFTLFSQKESSYQKEGYTKLFNGKDLTRWKIPEENKGHWSVIDNVIDSDARSESKKEKHLWSKKEYTDFKLYIKWRFKGYGDYLFKMPPILPNGNYLVDKKGEKITKLQPNADSGILLKGVGQTNLWYWEIGSEELWSVRNNKKLPKDVRVAATLSSNEDSPVGFWNSFDIIVKGNRITIKNNAIIVIDNAFYPGLDIKGWICLQNHGDYIKKTKKS